MVLASMPVLSDRRLAARPGRRAQQRLHGLCAQSTRRMAFSSVVLPTPGPPVMTTSLRRHGQPQGIALVRRQRQLQPTLHPVQCPFRVEGRPRRRHLPPARRRAPQSRARPRAARRGTRPACRATVSTTSPPSPSSRSSASETRGVGHAQQLRGARGEVLARQPGVPFVLRLQQDVLQAGADANHRRRRDAQLAGDPVGREEPDPADVARQTERVLANEPDRVAAVGLVDAHRARGADAVGVQEHHDLAHVALRLPALRNPRRPHRANARHVPQPRRAPARPRRRPRCRTRPRAGARSAGRCPSSAPTPGSARCLPSSPAATAFRYVQRNWRPCVRSVTHVPLACTCSPAEIAAAWPTTVTRSRTEGTATRRTQKPVSGLWNVTRSTVPDSSSRGWAPASAEGPRITTPPARRNKGPRPRCGSACKRPAERGASSGMPLPRPLADDARGEVGHIGDHAAHAPVEQPHDVLLAC